MLYTCMPQQVVSMVHLAEFWYNTCQHSALQHSPFEILYGHYPNHFGIDPDQDCTIPDLDEWLKNRQSITSIVQQ